MKEVNLTELQEGTNIFSSTGISKVKVTIGEEITCINVPITSTGVSELIDLFESNAPQPPTKPELIKPDNPLYKEMNLSKKTWVHMPDLADSEYKKKKEKHDSDLGLKILFQGIVLTVKDKDGNIIEDGEKKIEVLKKAGLSSDQFQQILDDITSLTRWSEGERENFFV